MMQASLNYDEQYRVSARNSTEIGWEPIVVEGRLEADTSSDDGIVYRLSDARVMTP